MPGASLLTGQSTFPLFTIVGEVRCQFVFLLLFKDVIFRPRYMYDPINDQIDRREPINEPIDRSSLIVMKEIDIFLRMA